jgi:lysozyme family protein
MKENFDQCLAHILNSEGGYVNNPKDPGGETNLGVTRKVWQDWVKRELTDDEMRHLTPEMVGPLYKAKYWDAISGDLLPAGVDLCVFDCAVNAGVSRAVRFLQHSVGSVEDGILGPKTLELVKSKEPKGLIKDLCAQREMHYKSLSTFSTFGKGWMNRLDRVEEDAIKMVSPESHG